MTHGSTKSSNTLAFAQQSACHAPKADMFDSKRYPPRMRSSAGKRSCRVTHAKNPARYKTAEDGEIQVERFVDKRQTSKKECNLKDSLLML